MTSDESEEQVRSEVDRISRALVKKPPEEIVIERPFFTGDAKFEKDGDRLILQGGWGIEDIKDQIVWTYLNKDRENHPNPLVRNPHRYDMLLTVLVGIGFFILIVSFPSIPFFLRILSIVCLISSYLIATYLFSPRKRAYAEFIADYMTRTNHWPEDVIEKFLDGAKMNGVGISIFFATILFVAGIAFAFVFNF